MSEKKNKSEQEVQETPVSMEDMKAMFAQMLEEAKAEAGKIVEEAKAEAKKIVEEAKAPTEGDTEEQAKAKAERKAWLNELVEIKLFKDNNKYKEPVFVSCNGETIAIERGVRVQIKRKFADILDNSEHQDYETAKLIAEKSGKMENLGDL